MEDCLFAYSWGKISLVHEDDLLLKFQTKLKPEYIYWPPKTHKSFRLMGNQLWLTKYRSGTNNSKGSKLKAAISYFSMV